MDKRTLFTVVSLALILFGVNFYFNAQREGQKKAQYQEQVAQEEAKRREQHARERERTASLSELPLAELQLNGRTLPAIRFGQELLTIDESGAPFLHGAKIMAQSPPLDGQHDLQLVTFEGGRAQVAYASWNGGRFEPPLHPPASNAIALWKGREGFVPVGVYWSHEAHYSPIAQLTALAETPKEEESAPVEKFYLLENSTQQFVFSNIGGALTEINLPFESSSNLSIVKEIGYDREMEKLYPQNDQYPSYSYYTPDGFHEGRQLGGYYPLLRRDLVDPKSGKIQRVPPRYYALNLISKYPELSELVYEVTHFDSHKLVMEANQNHRRIVRTYELPQDLEASPYVLDVTIQIEGNSQGLWLTTGVPEVEMLGKKPAPALKYRMTNNKKSDVAKIGLPKIGRPVTANSAYPDWVSNANAFFSIILSPEGEEISGYRVENVPITEVPSRFQAFNSQYLEFKPGELTGYAMQLPLPSDGGTMHFRLFAGPLQEAVLKQLDATYTDPATGVSPGYVGAKSFHGIFKWISRPFSKLLFWILQFCYFLTGSWGISIILLTVVLRLLLYPLNAWSLKSMRRMQKIQPEVQAIQARYKKEPRKAQMEVMALYRSKKVNPLMGCVPMLIQMPFLIAMFDLLKSSFDLRGASFITGWIDNLTAPDVLFSWSRPIFFFGTSFHLLPILLAGVMYIQQRMTSKLPKDKSLWTDQQRQQKLMGNMMVILFSVLFYNFASGLNLYWLSSMALGIAQQSWINRSLDKKDAAAEKKRAKSPAKKGKQLKVSRPTR